MACYKWITWLELFMWCQQLVSAITTVRCKSVFFYESLAVIRLVPRKVVRYYKVSTLQHDRYRQVWLYFITNHINRIPLCGLFSILSKIHLILSRMYKKEQVINLWRTCWKKTYCSQLIPELGRYILIK